MEKTSKSNESDKLRIEERRDVRESKKDVTSVSKKRFYKNFKFWICIGIIFIVLLVVTVILIIDNKKHEEAIIEYRNTWDAYAKAQNEFGFEFGSMLGEMGFSTDESAPYNLDSADQYDVSVKCVRKVGIYDEVYNNPYAVKDEEISGKSTSDIQKAVNSLTEFTQKINNAKDRVWECGEIGETKKKEIDDEKIKKEAEEKAKADEEAEKQRQKEESEAEYRRNKLDYDKFTNQIYEGMSLSTMKEVYGWFDKECKISSQSGGYVIYSCSSGSSYDFWAASFTFYNNILRSKAQTGLK